ncbi:LysM peptidoglycan-binding domain-containing protein [Actinomyces ruminis]|uniref:LysM peptidoglycan-binding domain-containing protein n=1 Tax=Actinomyces ruminis TaxID=1937003 RepID=A0ABX4M8B4_9ACTO|nr:LysM peptidoglycan-binding domain-containing protein [Actinomyces ruminis]PHP51692.1 LysM peptidoglycan-binding domain-containing protein [Actinomyces ruminis]
MSALAAPVPPRLRLVPTEEQHGSRLFVIGGAAGSTAPSPEPEGASADVPRPQLRLVVGGEAAGSESTVASSHVAAPPEVKRRPVAPQPRRRSLEELAPTHPAVRARASRTALTSVEIRVAQAPVMQRRVEPASAQRIAERSADRAALPVAVRRLLAAGALVLAAVLVAAGGIVASGFSAAPAQTTTTTVQSGQSLWDVAVATGVGDVNEVMAQIVELNGLTSSTLQPGQTLVVPAG